MKFIDCLTKSFEDKEGVEHTSHHHHITYSTASDRYRYMSDNNTMVFQFIVHCCYPHFAVRRSFLSDLRHTICLCVKELKIKYPDTPVCLIVDDFSLLLSFGLKIHELVDFIHFCHFLLCSSTGFCQVSFFLFIFSKISITKLALFQMYSITGKYIFSPFCS